MTTTILLLLALASPTAAARQACAPPAPTRLDSPYVYATAVVDGLAWIKKGTLRIPTTGPKEVSEVVKAIRSAEDDFACADRYTAPFVKSEGESIRKTAEALAKVHQAVGASTEAMAAALLAQAGDADDRWDEVIRQKDEAMGDLVVLTAYASTVLVEFQDEKPTGRLLVTRVERQALKSSLEKKFGKSIQGGMKEGMDPATTVAAHWYFVLADPGARSLDDGKATAPPGS
jgi:hypothetical protein